MNFYDSLIENNKNWVQNKVDMDPDYFRKLARGQSPPVLWIGCADSRVPANQIIGAQPGEVFVQRNIANMVIHTDMNMLSVLDYAVNALKVKHVIVCGHYGCGGVKAAMQNKGRLLVVEKKLIDADRISKTYQSFTKINSAGNEVFFVKDDLDNIIKRVFENGGDVEFIDNGLLKNYGHIALIENY